MKIRSFLLLVLLSIFTYLPGLAQKTLQNIVKKGELRIGMTGNQPPYTMKSKTGELIGFEVDIAEALAESLGVKLNLVELPFSELMAALEKGSIDAIMSGMTITPERNLKALFAGPYSISGKSILTKSKVLSEIDEAEDANKKQYKIVCLKGSNSEKFVRLLMPDAQLITVGKYDDGVNMVLKNQADAMVADYPICVLSVLRYGNEGLVTLDSPLTIEPIGMALPAKDAQFHNLIDNYLSSLALTGALDLLQTYWFEEDSWLVEMK
jgi:polar amino acid transport system substrate-binding protein